MAKQNIGIRVPDDVLQAIDEKCRTTGLSRTEVVLGLIQQGLNPTPANDANTLNANVSETASVTAVTYSENLAKKVESLGDKLAALAQRIRALERNANDTQGILEQDSEAANDTLHVSRQNEGIQSHTGASETLASVSGSLTGRSLAKRLGVHHSTIGEQRKKQNFAQWTRDRDPKGKVWEYREGMFHPVEP